MWFQPIQCVGRGLLVTMVPERYIGAAGWCYFNAPMLCSLKSRQEPRQWILSHFCKAPPLTDLAAAFKDWNEHQRQMRDFAFLSENYNLWSFPPMKKALPHLFPQLSLKVFQRNTQGLVVLCTKVRDSPNLPIFLPLHDAHVPSMGKWRAVWFKKQS